ncbi:MAG: hypothetical protein A2749_00305 [Parcubacteria group bacterium RIFCSPHIGHO2_01_FULL_45_26]|nr:MAG: hypothetical protein A2749_00305 [Parcubacteria group bacterium RIFCSPHIGHO2_01_FULL_45_26]
MNRERLVTGEHYHIYNRGVDKRFIFSDTKDVERFMLSMRVFNSVEPVLSIRDVLEIKEKVKRLPARKALVEFVAYCLNPNHYHFILRQLVDGGIAEFMKRLNGGYTWYFNKKNTRNGALLQGVYKSSLISDNDKLLELSAYVNLNNRVHKIHGDSAKLVRSSWDEYVNSRSGFCKKGIITNQFKSIKEYHKYAMNLLPLLQERKADEKELKKLLLDV